MKEYACTQERFLNDVKNHSMKVIRDEELSDDDADNLWLDIENEILSELENGPEFAFRAVYNFQPINMWEDFPNCNKYTFHYIWCLYAIVWGIQKYDREVWGIQEYDRGV